MIKVLLEISALFYWRDRRKFACNLAPYPTKQLPKYIWEMEKNAVLTVEGSNLAKCNV